eukprot:9483871-Ditylum_brightwellii.AAC.1
MRKHCTFQHSLFYKYVDLWIRLDVKSIDLRDRDSLQNPSVRNQNSHDLDCLSKLTPLYGPGTQ